MRAKLVAIPKKPTPDAAELKRTLRGLLRLIDEDGAIEGYLVVATHADGTVTRARSIRPNASRYKLLGLIEHSAHEINELIASERE
jgi:hypothetical protein